MLRSWCDTGDVFCDTVSTPVEIAHVNYVHTSGQEVVEFVIERWNEATGASVEVDAGGRFPTYQEYMAGLGGNATTTPTGASPTTSTSSPTGSGEPTETPGAAAGLTAGGLFIGVPMLLAGWELF